MKISKAGVVVIIIFVVVLVLAVLSPNILTGRLIDPTYRSCVDRDGENRYEKATVNYTSVWTQRFYTDYCLQTGNVREYFCNRVSKVRDRLYICTRGCEDGACKRKGVDKCGELSNKTKLKIQDLEERNLTIVLREADEVYVGDYVVLGHKNYGGYILKLVEINNNSIIFKDFSGGAEFKIEKEDDGISILYVMDKEYTVRHYYKNYVKLKWSDEELAEKFTNCEI